MACSDRYYYDYWDTHTSPQKSVQKWKILCLKFNFTKKNQEIQVQINKKGPKQPTILQIDKNGN